MKTVVITVSDDSDSEDVYTSTEQQLTEDYINIMNKQDRVKKILRFFDRNSEDNEVMISFTQLCHNLLLVYKDSIKKYM